MRVGFAGLGLMGAPMARNLIAAGHTLSVWNRSPDKARAFAEQNGCALADSPRALAAGAEVVLSMLADDAASTAVHEGVDGLFAGCAERPAAGGAHSLVCMGTLSPDHIEALAAAAPAGVQVVDAPVSGATQAACDGQLMIMAGGAREQLAPLLPLFDALGRRTLCLGRRGAGAVMKLAVNSLLHGINQALAEAMTLAEAAGIDAVDAFDTIEASAAGAPMLRYRRPLYLDEAAHAVTFTVALARKDMRVTAALARHYGVLMPQAQVTLAQLEAAAAAGYAERDMASMLNYKRETQA